MKEEIKDGLGWGFLVWLIGYGLGIVFFTIVPANLIGWFVMPVGIVISLWVLITRIHGKSFQHYVMIAFVWTFVAIVCDYFFLVRAFKTTAAYYKWDVYLYYTLTFLLPIFVGWKKTLFTSTK